MSTPNRHKKAANRQANQRVLVITSLAAFIVIFCLVASKTLFGQLYQNRIVQAKNDLSQLKKDFSAAQNL